VVAGCAAQHGELQVRATKNALSAQGMPASQRIQEANGQLALGNIALALEGYRRASREDLSSTDALAGMAICYDRMGRYDLSRRYHEAALAITPGDPRLLGLLADSLLLQGRIKDAARVRGEIATRAAAVSVNPIASASKATLAVDSAVARKLQAAAVPMASSDGSSVVAQRSPPPVSSVTVTLPAARPASLTRRNPSSGSSSDTTAPAVSTSPAPRLERLSGGEVALITSGVPLWRAETVASTARTTTVRFVPLRQTVASQRPVRLLNAARVDRLAARTRTWLAARGWREIMIGDAAVARSRSVILYPRAEHAAAQRLSAHLGFAMVERPTGGQLTILLGRDAARPRRS
jgi:hypothetical protein